MFTFAVENDSETLQNTNTMKTNYIFSKCKKLQGLLSEIYADLLEISDTEEQSRNEVKRYCKEFKRESDCNLVQYGNMLIYYDDVRDFYRKHGYKSVERMSDSAIWGTYCRQVGYVARLVAGDRL